MLIKIYFNTIVVRLFGRFTMATGVLIFHTLTLATVLPNRAARDLGQVENACAFFSDLPSEIITSQQLYSLLLSNEENDLLFSLSAKPEIFNKLSEQEIQSLPKSVFRALGMLSPITISRLSPVFLFSILTHPFADSLNWLSVQTRAITSVQMNAYSSDQIQLLPPRIITQLAPETYFKLKSSTLIEVMNHQQVTGLIAMESTLQDLRGNLLNRLNQTEIYSAKIWYLFDLSDKDFDDLDLTHKHLLFNHHNAHFSRDKQNQIILNLLNTFDKHDIQFMSEDWIFAITEENVANLDAEHRTSILFHNSAEYLPKVVINKLLTVDLLNRLDRWQVRSLSSRLIFEAESSLFTYLDTSTLNNLMTHPDRDVSFQVVRSFDANFLNSISENKLHLLPWSILSKIDIPKKNGLSCETIERIRRHPFVVHYKHQPSNDIDGDYLKKWHEVVHFFKRIELETEQSECLICDTLRMKCG